MKRPSASAVRRALQRVQPVMSFVVILINSCLFQLLSNFSLSDVDLYILWQVQRLPLKTTPL